MDTARKERESLKSRVDPGLLKNNIIMVTGGADTKHMPIVTFSMEALQKTEVTSEALKRLLCFQLSYLWEQQHSKCPTFAALANLAVCSKENIVLLVECLDAIQREGIGTVGTLYAISPMAHSNQKVLRKLLGVYPSKKYRRDPLYKVVVVADDEELTSHVDCTQLTPEFGGYLLFNFQNFLVFTRRVTELENAICECIERCPHAEQELVNATEGLDISRDSQTPRVLRNLRHSYHTIVSGMKMEELMDKCRELGHELTNPSDHSGIKTIKQHPLIIEKRNFLSNAHQQLLLWKQKLQSHWQTTEGQVVSDARLIKYERKIKKIHDWIISIGIRHARKNPPIASTASEAHIHSTHFNTSFYSTAKRVVWLSNKLTQKMETILDERHKSYDFSAASDKIEAFVKECQGTAQYFDQIVENKRKVLEDVENHFKGPNGINGATWQFEANQPRLIPNMNAVLSQLATWYEKVLRFIPLHLLEVKVESSDLDMTLFKSSAWSTSAKNFLLNHPPPWTNISELRKSAAYIQNDSDKKKAKKLIQRCGLLMKLLTQSQSLTSVEINDVLRWRKTVMHKTDDYVIRFSETASPHKVIQLQRIAENENGHDDTPFVILQQAQLGQQTSVSGTSKERYVSLGVEDGHKLPDRLRHINKHALEKNEPQDLKRTPSNRTKKELYRPAAIIASSDLTAEEKMAALTAFCESENIKPTKPTCAKSCENPSQSSSPLFESEESKPEAAAYLTPLTQLELSSLSEDFNVGVDIDKWMEEGLHDLDFLEDPYDSGDKRCLEDLEMDVSDAHLLRLRLESEDIIQDSIEDSLSRTDALLEGRDRTMNTKKSISDESVESGLGTLRDSKANPASLEILNTISDEDEHKSDEAVAIGSASGSNNWTACGDIPSWLR